MSKSNILFVLHKFRAPSFSTVPYVIGGHVFCTLVYFVLAHCTAQLPQCESPYFLWLYISTAVCMRAVSVGLCHFVHFKPHHSLIIHVVTLVTIVAAISYASACALQLWRTLHSYCSIFYDDVFNQFTVTLVYGMFSAFWLFISAIVLSHNNAPSNATESSSLSLSTGSSSSSITDDNLLLVVEDWAT